MIIRASCLTCKGRFTVTVRPASKFLFQSLIDGKDEEPFSSCPRRCGGKVNLYNNSSIDELSKDWKEPIELTAEEFYKAVMGAGLPDEIPRSPELVHSLLMAERIVVALVQEDRGSIYLHALKLANGVTLHLTAGRLGAQVLKVTRA